jgi:hypothetical protein
MPPTAYHYVNAKNVTPFREAFETYSAGKTWAERKAAGDFVFADGNVAGASYLVLSKSPWNVGTTEIETIADFPMPIELSIGAHRSQAVVGQEFAIAVVDTDTQIAEAAPVAISAISQSTTSITVDTATAHNLSIGMTVAVSGCADSRLNYSYLTVSGTPSPTQFTAVGNSGAIPSLTIPSPSPLGSPVATVRRRLNGANDGCSQIFETATATQSAFYVRSNSGDAMPSGSVAGAHAVTVGSTASVKPSGTDAAYSYPFVPTTEYRLNMASDRVQWHDSAIDVATGTTQRLIRTAVCPSPDRKYRLKLWGTNASGFTAPVAKMVSQSKTGATTATIVFDRPHNLTTADLIVAYGSRNQTDFPNLTTATAIASIVNSTTITVVWGATTPTITSYGGYVSRVNGGIVQGGAVAIVGQTVACSSNILRLTGSAAWTGAVVGDTVEVVGVRDASTGADLGMDGAFKVVNFETSGTVAVLAPIDGVVRAELLVTNCGGGVIKRTDFRISWARLFSASRDRVEFTPRPAADATGAVPVQLAGTPAVTASSVTGPAAHDSPISGNPLRIAGRGLSAAYTTLTTGDVADLITTLQGVLVTRPWQIPELEWSYAAAAGGIVNTTDVVLAAAAGAGLRRYITSLTMSNNSATATEVVLKDGATVIWRGHLPANAVNVAVSLQNPLRTTAATALNFACITTAAAVYVNAQGFTAA